MVHLELWAEWKEWITMGIYSPCDARLTQRESELQAEGHTTRRMTY